MSNTTSEPRLYLDTPRRFNPQDLAASLSDMLSAAPVACVRLTLADDVDESTWTLAVNHLIPVCHGVDVPLLVTDHFRLVAPLGLDGVHLSSAQTPIRDIRDVLGKDRIVGAFAGTSRHDGLVLAEAGADYVSFGPVGSTGALGADVRADNDLFAWWAEMIETPIVAEGALSLSDARRLAPMADFIVPDVAIWSDEDAAANLEAYAQALDPPAPEAG